jgi:hypothetical protein
MASQWGRVYSDNVGAVCTLAEALSDEQLASPVPGTPAWTVRNVLAHLAGGPADMVAGRMEGAPSPEWTARHVAERSDLPISELTAEMQRNQDAVAELSEDNPRPAIVWDSAVHHADLHEALALGVPAERFWRPVLEGVAPMMLGRSPVSLTCGDATYGAGGPALDVAPYELFRSLFSRRSRSQMQAWGGEALSPEELDGFCVFGPREDDQPVPA